MKRLDGEANGTRLRPKERNSTLNNSIIAAIAQLQAHVFTTTSNTILLNQSAKTKRSP